MQEDGATQRLSLKTSSLSLPNSEANKHEATRKFQGRLARQNRHCLKNKSEHRAADPALLLMSSGTTLSTPHNLWNPLPFIFSNNNMNKFGLKDFQVSSYGQILILILKKLLLRGINKLNLAGFRSQTVVRICQDQSEQSTSFPTLYREAVSKQ